mgnify:CR=1 FL=1
MEKNRIKFRYDILILISLFILLVIFSAYMMNTPIFDVLEDQRGVEVITHDNEYEYSNEK